MSVVIADDDEAVASQLHLCEQVLRRWQCQIERRNGSLIVEGDWKTVFDAVYEACQAFQPRMSESISTQLTFVRIGQQEEQDAIVHSNDNDNGSRSNASNSETPRHGCNGTCASSRCDEKKDLNRVSAST